jgi:hypothetical protein
MGYRLKIYWSLLVDPSQPSEDKDGVLEMYMNEIERIKGYVYLLHMEGTFFYKIGLTKNPGQRISAINDLDGSNTVVMPLDSDKVLIPNIVIDHLIETNDMFTLERTLHDRYKLQRVGKIPTRYSKGGSTEWFMLSAEQITEIKSRDGIYYYFGDCDF